MTFLNGAAGRHRGRMINDLKGYKIAFFGGDRRELEEADIFHRMGAEIRAVGLPWPDDVSWVSNAPEAVAAWAQIMVAPVGGVDEFGRVTYSIAGGNQPAPRLSRELLKHAPPGAALMIGKAQPELRRACEDCEIRMVEYREREDFATRNAVPSAEGAIAMAMEHTDITVHQSRSLVLGFGRTGAALSRILKGMGAYTTVAARSSLDLARIYAAGHRALPLRDVRDVMEEQDIIFNTIPALVLTDDHLALCRQETVIVDLASAPGGTDFAAAKRHHVKALLAPGLPGIVAPKTAGRIVAETLLTIFDEMNL